MTRNMKAGNWQCITTVSCRLLPVMFAESYTAPHICLPDYLWMNFLLPLTTMPL